MTADFVPKHGSRKPVKKIIEKLFFALFGRSAFALPPLWLRCSSVPKEWRRNGAGMAAYRPRSVNGY